MTSWFALLLLAVAGTDPHAGHGHHSGHAGHEHNSAESPQHGDEVFYVEISPEARVSVQRNGLAPRVACGAEIVLTVAVRNDSSVQVPLGVEVLSTGAELLRSPLPLLSGEIDQRLEFALRLTLPPPVDVSLAFDAGPGTQDLGWRSQTHILIDCDPDPG